MVKVEGCLCYILVIIKTIYIFIHVCVVLFLLIQSTPSTTCLLEKSIKLDLKLIEMSYKDWR